MDASFLEALNNLNAMPASDVNARAQRRFRDQVEAPLSKLLNLDAPDGQIENVYVTWVKDSNNIDNRMWQVQNKLLKLDAPPRIAVALCNENIVDDRMWLESAKTLTRIAPYLSPHNFEGVAIAVTSDERETFEFRRFLGLRGGGLAEAFSAALAPEVTTEWYDTPLASRRPHQRASGTGDASYRELLAAYRNVIVEGVSGTGKSYLFGDLMGDFGADHVEIAVFHPNSTYEDFVEALRPSASGHFEVVDGRFLAFCKRAAEAPDSNFLFIVDEINRAPTARVLGDLLYAIEPSKRVNAVTARRVLGHTHDDTFPTGLDGVNPPTRLQLRRGDAATGTTYRALFCVPDNVYILGTMNTSDHSIGGIDLALRRRFVFRRHEVLGADELRSALESVDPRWAALNVEIAVWSAMNDVLATTSPDACLGHSYFFEAIQAADRVGRSADMSAVATMLWRDLLLPQLAAALTAFDAGYLLEKLAATAAASPSTTGGYWIEAQGSGIDVAFIVVERSGTDGGGSGETAPPALPTASAPSLAQGPSLAARAQPAEAPPGAPGGADPGAGVTAPPDGAAEGPPTAAE